jgi:hypothetical protein
MGKAAALEIKWPVCELHRLHILLRLRMRGAILPQYIFMA